MERRDTRHLFLDTDSLREWDTGIVQRFPHAEKVPVSGLEPGPAGSWDARVTTIYGSVLIEDGLFRMWYCCMPDAQSHQEGPDHGLTCYAESDDGLNWRKPDLGITGQRRWPGNNLLPLPGFVMGVVPALPATGARYLAAVVQILPLEPDVCDVPGVKFSGSGTYIFASDDGLRWRNVTERPLLEHGDVACLAVDPDCSRYILYQKVGAMHGLDLRRSFIGLESEDGASWEGYRGVGDWHECFVADDYDDLLAARRGFRIADTYGVALYRAGGLYVAVEDVFHIGSPLRFNFGQNAYGLCSLRLAYSHDAMHWRHPKGRPSWLELGAPGEFDAGFMVPASALVEHGDRLLLYYGGSCYDHGWCIDPDFSLRKDVPLEDQRRSGRVGLATIRRDRFASLTATYKGRVAVEAGRRRGEALLINACCPQGSVRVGVKAGSGAREDFLPGMSPEDCVPFTGDEVRAPVRFRNVFVADVPADVNLFLTFEITRGELFAFEWGEASAPEA